MRRTWMRFRSSPSFRCEWLFVHSLFKGWSHPLSGNLLLRVTIRLFPRVAHPAVVIGVSGRPPIVDARGTSSLPAPSPALRTEANVEVTDAEPECSGHPQAGMPDATISDPVSLRFFSAISARAAPERSVGGSPRPPVSFRERKPGRFQYSSRKGASAHLN